MLSSAKSLQPQNFSSLPRIDRTERLLLPSQYLLLGRYKCSEAHWRGDVIWESNERSGFFIRGSPEYTIGSVMILVKSASITDAFEGILDGYLCCSFSRPENILNGFTGIIHFMAKTYKMGGFFHGLPKKNFHNGICW